MVLVGREHVQGLKVTITLVHLLLCIDCLLTEDKLDVQTIIDLVLFGVFNGNQRVLEVHNGTLEAH